MENEIKLKWQILQDIKNNEALNLPRIIITREQKSFKSLQNNDVANNLQNSGKHVYEKLTRIISRLFACLHDFMFCAYN